MKKSVLVLGATGMAGHMIYYYLKSLNECTVHTACFRNKISEGSILLDVYDTKHLGNILKETKPDYVINCVGVLIKGSLNSPKNAIYINSYFPHLLLQLIGEESPDTKLVHISTDCVFSGNKGHYADMDAKDALDTYGMTKNLGEIVDDHNLTIRTSIIGPELKENGEGLFHWVFSQQGAGQIRGYDKSFWGGITTLELAKAIRQCLENNVTGLFQLTNGEKISKYDLIKIIIDRFGLKINLQRNSDVVNDKSIKPSHRDGFFYAVPPYDAMVEELHQFMREHKGIYQMYVG
jgi:dTDP-4-dehydrorhamnose reductase